jgi:hypothetical protein
MEYREVIIADSFGKSSGAPWAQKVTSWVFCKNGKTEKLFEKK